jgi:hypothetical protein
LCIQNHYCHHITNYTLHSFIVFHIENCFKQSFGFQRDLYFIYDKLLVRKPVAAAAVLVVIAEVEVVVVVVVVGLVVVEVVIVVIAIVVVVEGAVVVGQVVVV